MILTRVLGVQLGAIVRRPGEGRLRTARRGTRAFNICWQDYPGASLDNHPLPVTDRLLRTRYASCGTEGRLLLRHMLVQAMGTGITPQSKTMEKVCS